MFGHESAVTHSYLFMIQRSAESYPSTNRVTDGDHCKNDDTNL